MNTERINQIKEGLAGLGTKEGELYTNQEIIDLLKELQSALAKGVFEKTHAENLRDRDIMIHFEALAKEYDLDQTETFLRFKENMKNMGYTIGSYIKGVNGEKSTRRALKLLSFDKGVRILYNVQLKNSDAEAEYDAIVITPYGLFVVEVKNWDSSVLITPNGLLKRDDNGVVYDLIGRISIKEALLRECVGDDFPESYHSVLVFPNEKLEIEDQYHKISVICGEGVSYKIREFNTRRPLLTSQQITNIEQAIIRHHEIQKTASPVDCDEIIEDYAMLMAWIEEASMGQVADAQASGLKLEPVQPEPLPQNEGDAKQTSWGGWENVSKYVVNTVRIVVPVIICGLLQTRKR